jgi:hypothetical protein
MESIFGCVESVDSGIKGRVFRPLSAIPRVDMNREHELRDEQNRTMLDEPRSVAKRSSASLSNHVLQRGASHDDTNGSRTQRLA